MGIEGPQGIKDAAWTVRPIEYVDPEPPLQSSLFDNPAHLSEALDNTFASLEAQANEPVAHRDEVIARTAAFLAELDAIDADVVAS